MPHGSLHCSGMAHGIEESSPAARATVSAVASCPPASRPGAAGMRFGPRLQYPAAHKTHLYRIDLPVIACISACRRRSWVGPDRS
jgi:hypothetical protein